MWAGSLGSLSAVVWDRPPPSTAGHGRGLGSARVGGTDWVGLAGAPERSMTSTRRRNRFRAIRRESESSWREVQHAYEGVYDMALYGRLARGASSRVTRCVSEVGASRRRGTRRLATGSFAVSFAWVRDGSQVLLGPENIQRTPCAAGRPEARRRHWTLGREEGALWVHARRSPYSRASGVALPWSGACEFSFRVRRLVACGSSRYACSGLAGRRDNLKLRHRRSDQEGCSAVFAGGHWQVRERIVARLRLFDTGQERALL